ncbi:MAG: hypothetical protein KAY27_00595 [Pedobacter sp.]|nr:hypothetical protein [Pedobacter sp.]
MKKLKFTVLSGVMFLTAVLTNLSFTFPSTVDEIKKFSILVENTSNGVKLTCTEGAAWKELAFSLKQDESQFVDQFGMTTAKQEGTTKDSKLADFLFTIKKTKDGFSYKGMKGTAWKELSYGSDTNERRHSIAEDGVRGIN